MIANCVDGGFENQSEQMKDLSKFFEKQKNQWLEQQNSSSKLEFVPFVVDDKTELIIWPISARNGHGIEKLKKSLEERLKNSKLERISSENRSVLDYIQQIERIRLQNENKLPILEWKEFEENSILFDFKDELEKQRKLKECALYLNTIGAIVYFDKDGLRDKVCIDPQWINKLFGQSLKFASDSKLHK